MADAAPQWFSNAMAAVAEAYGYRVTEQRIRSYASDLSDVPQDVFLAALRAAARECKFFPTIAEIRERVTGRVEDRALVAWSSLRAAAADIGAYTTVELEDPAAVRALLTVFGSWPEFCVAEDGPRLSQQRTEFMAVYRSAQGFISGEPVRLPGLLGDPRAGANVRRLYVGRVSAAGAITSHEEINEPQNSLVRVGRAIDLERA